MNKSILFSVLCLLNIITLPAQTFLDEDFEGGQFPDEWTIETSATDGGWIIGTPGSLSSDAFVVLPNGSSRVAATNDDGCNCDKSNDLLIMSPIDLTGQSNVVLNYDVYYTDNSYQGVEENATVEVSIDGGTTWTIIEDIEGDASWKTRGIFLNDYAGESDVLIGFRYNDAGSWLYGIAIDNVKVWVPPALDVNLVKINSAIYGETGKVLALKGIVRNGGWNTINSLEISYTVNNGAAVSEVVNNLNIAPLDEANFELTNSWVPTAIGNYDIDITIIAVNGEMDQDVTNNRGSFTTEIFEEVIIPNKIDEFVASGFPELTEITAASNSLNGPTDLDFFPILGRDQLWIVNEETEDSGGSTLMISNASDAPTTFDSRTDGNAWHFMSLPSAIAFSDDNFNFATSPGVQDANHSGGTFTGPTLWSSDLDIYAMPSGGNGSHLDMLHGSPNSRGIAHEKDNVFWLYDDWHDEIVRYDFVDDHGPGNDYHGDGIVRRYRGMGLSGDGDIPNHMILDKETGWLYFVDNGNDRVLRLDINSGEQPNEIPVTNEPLAEHSVINNFKFEVIIDTGLEQACGIEILENRLLVGDYANGNIVVYDMENDFAELGVIRTENPGLTGIKVGPKGNIWFTNRDDNTVNVAEPGQISSSEILINDRNVQVNPNPTTGLLNIDVINIDLNSALQIEVFDVTGKEVLSKRQSANQVKLDLSAFENGVYFLKLQSDAFSNIKRVVLSK